MSESDYAMQMANVVTEATCLVAALDHIRDGRLDRATELLEVQLNNAVLSLNGLTGKVTPRDQELIIDAMRSVRDYRVRHPRQAETEVGSVGGKLQRGLQELQKNVDTILETLA